MLKFTLDLEALRNKTKEEKEEEEEIKKKTLRLSSE